MWSRDVISPVLNLANNRENKFVEQNIFGYELTEN